ncbi:MAG: tetratricopeptide repeat protein [Dehalococcoidia bacterium]|nr:tetratricopeptide repeat protein [Dehalococcoidia bacterium]
MKGIVAGLLAILVAGLIAHAPPTEAGFNWDDDSYLTRNTLVGRDDGLVDIWLKPQASPQYYPLVFTGFWIEGRLWGLNPLGFRWTNVLMHLAAALLLWQLIRQCGWRGGWIAGLLFAVHPMTVESVAWITERKNVQALLLMLLALLAQARSAGLTAAAPRRHDAPLALLLFVAALLSKTMASCAVVFAWLMMIQAGHHNPLVAARRLWPWALAALTLGLHTAWLEVAHVGAHGNHWELDPGQHLVLAARIVWHYLATFAWPVDLCFSSPRWDLALLGGRAWGLVMALVCTLAALWSQRTMRALALATLAALFPALGFFNVYPMRFSWVADHFAHFALVPLCLGTALALTSLKRWGRIMPALAALALAAPLALMAREHGKSFANIETLWTTTLERHPRSFLAVHNLGVLRLNAGLQAPEGKERTRLLNTAGTLLEQARDLVPTDPLSLTNLARLEQARGNRPGAWALLAKARLLDPGHPQLHFVTARLEESANNWPAALAAYKACLARSPHHLQARRRLANAHWRLGDADRAEQILSDLLQERPAPWHAQGNPVWDQATQNLRELRQLRP